VLQKNTLMVDDSKLLDTSATVKNRANAPPQEVLFLVVEPRENFCTHLKRVTEFKLPFIKYQRPPVFVPKGIVCACVKEGMSTLTTRLARPILEHEYLIFQDPRRMP
jgi:hypothetical protein